MALIPLKTVSLKNGVVGYGARYRINSASLSRATDTRRSVITLLGLSRCGVIGPRASDDLRARSESQAGAGHEDGWWIDDRRRPRRPVPFGIE